MDGIHFDEKNGGGGHNLCDAIYFNVKLMRMALHFFVHDYWTVAKCDFVFSSFAHIFFFRRMFSFCTLRSL